MRISIVTLSKLIVLAILPLVLGGCPKKKPLTPVEAEVEEVLDEGTILEIGTSEWMTAPQLGIVYFETNKSRLLPEARAALKKNAEILNYIVEKEPSVQIRLEGHCDERDTLEYNLALGQRRANSVRDYYVSLGVPRDALTTISYGEERPVCTESREGCWRRNRRGMTTLKSTSDEPIRVPLGPIIENP